MLKRIKIQNYKSLRDVEVDLQPLTVLFGPNAVGKSNFLDALQLLSRIVSSRTIKTAFDPPYRGKPLESYSIDSGGLEQFQEKESMKFSIEVDVELSDVVIEKVHKQISDMRENTSSDKPKEPSRHPRIRERFLRYYVEVEILPKTGILRIADESLTSLTSKEEVSRSRSPFLSRDLENNRLHLRMEGQSHPRYFDLGLDHSILSLPLYTPHFPHISAFREEVAQYAFFYFEPRERMRNTCPVREIRQVGAMGEDLPSFLNTLKVTNPLQFKGIESALHEIVPSITGIEVKPNQFGEVDLWVKEGDKLMSSRVISEGTLRILGLLAIFGTKKGPSLVGFEEPENGIPPRQIGLIAEMLQSKAKQNVQIIVTTHSAILVDRIPHKLLFPCRKIDGTTMIDTLYRCPPLFKKQVINEAFDENQVDEMLEKLPISQRMIRGDFDE
ncbi:MAG: AAA family ATPase [Planctomycetaceae bacterium]|nr:AAA family ATPase [Planctomycetaceae bacterium]